MGRHLVLVGGGHAHLTTLMSIGRFVERGHRVTVIGPFPCHYYSGMGPGMLGEFYSPEEIRFEIKKMAENRGAAFIEGRVMRIDPKKRRLRLLSGETVDYDVASFNIGSGVPGGLIAGTGEGILPVKPIENLIHAKSRILRLIGEKEPELLVVGGGPSGLEVAGNLWRLVRNHGGKARIVLFAGGRLLSGFPGKARKLALDSLAPRGVVVHENTPVHRIENGRAITEAGRVCTFDLCLLAVGVKPAQLFAQSGIPTGDDGGLLVNEHLQSVRHPEIFGGGDCIRFAPAPLDKVGVYAVRENPVLRDNLLSAMEDGQLTPFRPQRRYMLIFNLGDGKGILCRNSRALNGRLAFLLKDHIDRKFMKRFRLA